MTLAKTRILLAAYAISGIAALFYEIGWMRELSTMLGATAYASGIMLGAFMTGLGIGALAGVWLSKRITHLLRAASFIELAIAVCSIIAFLGLRYLPVYFFNWMHRASTGSAAGFLTLQFTSSFLVMVLPTIAMGMTYPLIIRAVGRDRSIGSVSGQLYAVNTAGAILGSLAVSFISLPLIGVKGSLIVAAVLSIISALLLRTLAESQIDLLAFFKSPTWIIAVMVITVLTLIPQRTGSPLGLGQAFFYRDAKAFEWSASRRTTLFDREGIYSRVQVIRDANGITHMFNGSLDEGTDADTDRTTAILTAAVPALSIEDRGEALVVGLGLGCTSETLYDLEFNQVTTIEINPDVVTAAAYFLNQDYSSSPRWTLHIDDARAYLLTTPSRYDCIASAPSWPWSSGGAALFTREFMQAAQSHLTPDGVYCQWLPNYLLQIEDAQMMYKTMRSVFDRVDVWSINFEGEQTAELLMVGYHNPSGIGQAEVKARIDASIAEGTFDNEFITADSITPYSGPINTPSVIDDPEIPLNTDNHSKLEYRVFWNYLKRAFAH